MNVAVAAIMLFSQLAYSSSQVVVARPEDSAGNVVHVGQVLVIPLYDGKITLGPGMASGLRFVGHRRIRKHDLLEDLRIQDLRMKSAYGGYDAASDRGEAFLVEQRGGGSLNVTLRLPQYKDRCVSCRTVHFFYRVE
jgi:hypothetical protein